MSKLKIVSNDGDKAVLLDEVTGRIFVGDRVLHPGVQRDQFLKDCVPGQVIETVSSYTEALRLSAERRRATK
jgi:hypothetical protein